MFIRVCLVLIEFDFDIEKVNFRVSAYTAVDILQNIFEVGLNFLF